MQTTNFKELNIWKDSMKLCSKVYRQTENFPKSETFGITSQIRRSVVSIPSNIAEGSGRNSLKEYAQFISISIGSAYELETQLKIANDLGYLNPESFSLLAQDLQSIERMLTGYKSHLERKVLVRLRSFLLATFIVVALLNI